MYPLQLGSTIHYFDKLFMFSCNGFFHLLNREITLMIITLISVEKDNYLALMISEDCMQNSNGNKQPTSLPNYNAYEPKQ